MFYYGLAGVWEGPAGPEHTPARPPAALSRISRVNSVNFDQLKKTLISVKLRLYSKSVAKNRKITRKKNQKGHHVALESNLSFSYGNFPVINVECLCHVIISFVVIRV